MHLFSHDASDLPRFRTLALSVIVVVKVRLRLIRLLLRELEVCVLFINRWAEVNAALPAEHEARGELGTAGGANVIGIILSGQCGKARRNKALRLGTRLVTQPQLLLLLLGRDALLYDLAFFKGALLCRVFDHDSEMRGVRVEVVALVRPEGHGLAMLGIDVDRDSWLERWRLSVQVTVLCTTRSEGVRSIGRRYDWRGRLEICNNALQGREGIARLVRGRRSIVLGTTVVLLVPRVCVPITGTVRGGSPALLTLNRASATRGLVVVPARFLSSVPVGAFARGRLGTRFTSLLGDAGLPLAALIASGSRALRASASVSVSACPTAVRGRWLASLRSAVIIARIGARLLFLLLAWRLRLLSLGLFIRHVVRNKVHRTFEFTVGRVFCFPLQEAVLRLKCQDRVSAESG